MTRDIWLTSIDLILDNRVLCALIHLGHGLFSTWAVDVARSVHNLLKRVTLPTENVVTMVAIAGPNHSVWAELRSLWSWYLLVTITPDEGLRAVSGPVTFLVEWSGIPDGLQHKLRHSDGMRSRAFGFCSSSSDTSSTAFGICHMAPMIRRVKRFTIPAALKCKLLNKSNEAREPTLGRKDWPWFQPCMASSGSLWSLENGSSSFPNKCKWVQWSWQPLAVYEHQDFQRACGIPKVIREWI